jgi:hypothetical protein
MPTLFSGKSIAILVVLAVIGIAGYAMADSYGYGRGGYGPGNCPNWSERGGRGWGANLDQATLDEIQAKRQAFRESTQDLRRQIYQKRLAIDSEMANAEPVADTVLKLQKELSDLKADLDMKRMEFKLELKKAYPDLPFKALANSGRGYGKRAGRGGGSRW